MLLVVGEWPVDLIAVPCRIDVHEHAPSRKSEVAAQVDELGGSGHWWLPQKLVSGPIGQFDVEGGLGEVFPVVLDPIEGLCFRGVLLRTEGLPVSQVCITLAMLMMRSALNETDVAEVALDHCVGLPEVLDPRRGRIDTALRVERLARVWVAAC